ncbi:MAG: hypothetical protein MJ250_04725 [Alphaproteobacteria bacterium]|nr:hypothetical protein [Alphaproteobacteria bacterium]
MEIVDRKLQALFEQPIPQKVYDPKAELLVDVDISLCTEEERPRMIDIVNRLSKSEAGKETLEIAASAGYKFGFLDAGTNCFGCCFGGIDCIGLGPMASDDKLVSTLCHESRHAGQGVRMSEYPDRDKLDVASIIRQSRAKEADAQAYALKACKELELQGDKGPLETFGKFYPPIFKAYEQAWAQEGEINNKFVAGVFKGWYDQTGTKQNYEEGYIIEPMHDTLKAIKTDGKDVDPENIFTFEKSMDSKTVVEKIGWTKNGNYLADENPDFLNEDRFLSIGERTKKDAIDFFKLREELNGQKPDLTPNTMPTHKDAFARRLPEMGKPKSDEQETMSMGNTIDKWTALLAAKGKTLGR